MFIICKQSYTLRPNSFTDPKASELLEDTIKLKSKLEAAETARQRNYPTYTIDDSKKRLEAIYQRS